MSMVEIHNSVAKIYEENRDTLEIFECLDEFSDTQNFAIIMVLILKTPVMQF